MSLHEFHIFVFLLSKKKRKADACPNFFKGKLRSPCILLDADNTLCYILADCTLKKLIADEGEVTSPYFNTMYPNNVDCAWTISVEAGQNDHVLGLKFTTFNLEQSADCNADYVEIRDGADKTAPLIGNKLILLFKGRKLFRKKLRELSRSAKETVFRNT